MYIYTMYIYSKRDIFAKNGNLSCGDITGMVRLSYDIIR